MRIVSILFLCVCTALLVAQESKLNITHPPMVSYIGGRTEGAELTTTVQQDGDKFRYTYILKNVGKKDTWIAGSSLLDLVILGQNEVINFYQLEPGKSTGFSFTHKDKPVECRGVTSVFVQGKLDNEDIKERGLEKVEIFGIKALHSFRLMGGTNGWIPESLLPKEKK